MQTTLKPLQIGPITLGFPAVQAALSGYSDLPMRVLARRHGASYTLCEVMLDEFLVQLKDRKRTSHFLQIDPTEHPVGGQLMGADPKQFALGAERLVAAGFDVIDINFGCPVKKVLGRCRGGYHLSQPEVALEIVRLTRAAVPPEIPVTIKMRRGLDDTPASRDNFFRILDGAFHLGIAGITVHGRTVVQKYVGPSRWEFLREVKAYVGDRTIIGSGDLFTPQDCVRMLNETGVDGVSIARGAIGNPWIFQQVAALLETGQTGDPPGLHEQRDLIIEHFRLAEELYGPERAGPVMRKFGIKYAALHPNYLEVRAEFVRVRSFDDWRRVLDKWYAEDAPGVFPDGSQHKAQGSLECG